MQQISVVCVSVYKKALFALFFKSANFFPPPKYLGGFRKLNFLEFCPTFFKWGGWSRQSLVPSKFAILRLAFSVLFENFLKMILEKKEGRWGLILTLPPGCFEFGWKDIFGSIFLLRQKENLSKILFLFQVLEKMKNMEGEDGEKILRGVGEEEEDFI